MNQPARTGGKMQVSTWMFSGHARLIALSAFFFWQRTSFRCRKLVPVRMTPLQLDCLRRPGEAPREFKHLGDAFWTKLRSLGRPPSSACCGEKGGRHLGELLKKALTLSFSAELRFEIACFAGSYYQLDYPGLANA